MKDIIAALRQSLKDENYVASLALCLLLPDICGKMENKSGSKARYIEWFQKYLSSKYDGFLSGLDCYALRCAVLHEASDDIEDKDRDVLQQFYFVTKGPHRNLFSNCTFGSPKYDSKEMLQLSVYDLCQDFMNAFQQWMDDVKLDPEIQRRLELALTIHKPGDGLGGVIFR